VLISIILANLVSSLMSLLGGIFLIWKGKIARKSSLYLVAFAAGAMITTAFVGLTAEALELAGGKYEVVINGLFYGFVMFFMLERFLLWFHHHHEHSEPNLTPTKYLLVLGDTLHNFLDGVIIAGSFIADPKLGILSSVVVGLHEIPQEIGDFGALLHLGTPPSRVLGANLVSALFAVFGGVVGFFFLEGSKSLIPLFLGIAAGSFVYISASDLIPELHVGSKRSEAVKQTLAFFLGAVVIFTVSKMLPG